MKSKFLNVFLATFLLISNISLSQEKAEINGKPEILLKDYKQFVFYTRDSIMRSLIAEQIVDFGVYDSEENMIDINWQIDIDLLDEELLDILTFYCDFEESKFLFNVENNKLIADTEKLQYNSVNIFPNISIINFKNIENKLSVYDNWLEEYDTLNVVPFLSSNQLIQYLNWTAIHDKKEVKRLLKRKYIPEKLAFPCDSSKDWRSGLRREISKNENGFYYVKGLDSYGKLVYSGEYSSLYPEIKNGNFEFYENKEEYIYATGKYFNDIPQGKWNYFNSHGDTVMTINFSELYREIEKDNHILKSLTANDNFEVYKLSDVDSLPEFNSLKYNSFSGYISENFQLPPYIKINNRKYNYFRSTKVSFVIDKNGKIRFPNILNGEIPEFNLELIRILLYSPNWKPAVLNNKNVNVQFELDLAY